MTELSSIARRACLQGSWKYKESDWIALPGTFVCERPGEAHTLQILGSETMVSFFHVMGPHITLDADGREIGYVDAFRLLEYCRRYDDGEWSGSILLGQDHPLRRRKTRLRFTRR